MKTLDVEHIFTEFEKTLTDVSKVAEQISSVESAIKSFHNTDESFKGKMADSMRAYYYDCHLPFLEFLQKSLEDLKAKLKQMKEVIQEFEPHSQGYINEDFLSGELKSGFDKARDVTVQLTEETNDILRGVRDIIDLSPIDDSLFIDSIEKGKTNVDKIVERLHEVDKQGQKILEGAREDLDAMMKYLSDLVGKVKNGSIDIENYSMLSAINLDGYQALIEKVHGENVFYGAEIEAIMEKVNIDEDENGNIVNISSVPLSDREKDLLYEYIHGVYLTNEQKDYLQSIPTLINENDINGLKSHLNKNVIDSRENLAKELMIVQLYLYTGSKSPEETHLIDTTVDNSETYYYKLKTYELLLNDYLTTMGENTVIEIVDLEYKPNHLEDTPYHLSSSLDKAEYSKEYQDLMDRDEFKEFMFDRENFLAIHHHGTEVSYYAGGHGTMSFLNTLNDEEREKKVNYNKKYWGDWIANTVGSTIASAKNLSIPLTIVSSIDGYKKGENELDSNISLGDSISYGGRMFFETGVTNVKRTDGADKQHMIAFYPSQQTYDFFERWEEESKRDDNVDYPEEAIKMEDWEAVISNLNDLKAYNLRLYEDIIFGEGD